MATFEAYVTVGELSIAVSAVGSPIAVQSKEGNVDRPRAILTVWVPSGSLETVTTRRGEGSGPLVVAGVP